MRQYGRLFGCGSDLFGVETAVARAASKGLIFISGDKTWFETSHTPAAGEKCMIIGIGDKVYALVSESGPAELMIFQWTAEDFPEDARLDRGPLIFGNRVVIAGGGAGPSTIYGYDFEGTKQWEFVFDARLTGLIVKNDRLFATYTDRFEPWDGTIKEIGTDGEYVNTRACHNFGTGASSSYELSDRGGHNDMILVLENGNSEIFYDEALTSVCYRAKKAWPLSGAIVGYQNYYMDYMMTSDCYAYGLSTCSEDWKRYKKYYPQSISYDGTIYVKSGSQYAYMDESDGTTTNIFDELPNTRPEIKDDFFYYRSIGGRIVKRSLDGEEIWRSENAYYMREGFDAPNRFHIDDEGYVHFITSKLEDGLYYHDYYLLTPLGKEQEHHVLPYSGSATDRIDFCIAGTGGYVFFRDTIKELYCWKKRGTPIIE